MDADSYPSDLVKKFLAPLVNMKLNTQAGKDGPRMAKEFEVKSLPTLLLIKPNGEPLHRVSGGPDGPEQFVGTLTNTFWNEYVAAENDGARDKRKMAENLFVLVTWFSHAEPGQRAVEAKKKYESDAEFKSAWEELSKTTERQNLWAKADAQMKLKRKKDDIVATLKLIVEKHPDTKEAKDSLALLKKMGVKMEAPAEPKK